MTKKFVIGRYYFNSLFKDQADKSFVEDLKRRPFIEEKNFEYALGDFNIEAHKDVSLLRGIFGRIRKHDFADTYDREKKEFKKEALPKIADAILEFIIELKSHLIFVEYDYLIKPNYFVNKFKKIYAKTAPLAQLEMDFILIEKNIYEMIKKWQRIEVVTFKKLRPSNPSSLDDFRDIEDLLKETKSEKTNIDFHAPSRRDADDSSGGLNHRSKLIKQGIALSSHGYGEAKLRGVEDGKEVEVESKRFLKKVEIDFTQDGALDKIVQTIEEINNKEKNGKSNKSN